MKNDTDFVRLEEYMNAKPPFDAAQRRADFPILTREVRPGVPVVYLDSTATSQKPLTVIEAMNNYYRLSNANVHRGIHALAEEATALYEGGRERVAKFINARTTKEIIFTRNTSEAINLVAYSWGRANIRAGDVIVLTEMEHHSNLVPWQMLAAERGARLEFIPVTDGGELDLSTLDRLLALSPKLVCFTHMSNVLGTINPVTEIAAKAHAAGALVLVDGAQSVPHLPVDVQTLGADFLAFSAHKMCGPTGIGVLWGRQALLEEMPPFLGGGDMIKRVYLREFKPNALPYKFEAGTPAIAEAIGFGAAVDYLSSVGREAIQAHEQEIIAYAIERLEEVPGVKVYGPPAEKKGGVAAFTLNGIHPHDIAQVLDRDGIAIRAGHHCAMPLHDRYQLTATARASFYLYNTPQEVDKLIEGLYKVKRMFG
ncbi:MAG: cysteine desulfurase/selenocysteine lyase [Anaerolineales bacterium]|nr:cysteine desulfurase/selenocysteine lyase [Anaerolineales bacterium]MBM2848148.1 cysteine desulfurase/selenocysteine lyase [Anaerolineales bacterium]